MLTVNTGGAVLPEWSYNAAPPFLGFCYENAFVLQFSTLSCN